MKSITGVRLVSNGQYWQAQWRDGDGRRVVRSLGSKQSLSEAAARRECVKLEAKHMVRPQSAKGISTATIDQWRDRFLSMHPRLKDGTVALYRSTFARLSDRFGGGCRIDKIDQRAAMDFAAWLSEQPDGRRSDQDRKIGPDTVARTIRELRRAWEVAIRAGHATENPWRAVQVSACAASDWEYVTAEQSLEMAMACTNGHVGSLVMLCRHAALRRGEAIRLTWADVDLERRVIRIQPEADADGRRVVGTKQGYRTVPMSPTMRGYLISIKKGSDGPVIDGQFSTANLSRYLDAARRRVGLKPYGKPLHSLRKSCVSDWLALGCPVSDVALWAGHSPEVLMKHYAAVIQTSSARVTGQEDPEIVKLRARVAELELAESAKKDGCDESDAMDRK
jgi:integrase